MSAIDLGRFRLHVVSDGRFKLDGGAMFGVIPKKMWQREKAADTDNRIDMGTNCLLIEAGERTRAGRYRPRGQAGREVPAASSLTKRGRRRLPEAIRAAGFALEDVTHVVLTHLHFDHCGWNTRLDAHGNPVATFPKRALLHEPRRSRACAPAERARPGELLSLELGAAHRGRQGRAVRRRSAKSCRESGRRRRRGTMPTCAS